MSNKLHPVYVALDGHQYSRAIKLCLALPKTNTLGQALLAHAYAKSGQRYKALLTMQGILGSDLFPELQLEIHYSLERREEAVLAASNTQTAATASARKPAVKKGKKKTAVVTNNLGSSATNAPAEILKDWDLIDQLETPPRLPEDWGRLPSPEGAPTDHTLLATLAMTMSSTLRMPLTAHQLYCWAASKVDTDEEILRKAYTSGLAVLVAPQYESISIDVLANMQVLAMQLARLQQQLFDSSPATAWAAQTALWQLQYQDSKTVDAKQKQRLQMLPRLAESLAAKAADNPASQGMSSDDSLILAEVFQLYMRTLDIQSKWEEKLAAIEKRLHDASDHVHPPRHTLLAMKADVFLKLERFDDARSVIEGLIAESPDDWKLWTAHCDCLKASGQDPSTTLNLIDTVLAAAGTEKRQYPLRGPQLIKLEITANQLREGSGSEEAVIDAVMQYGNQFSGISHCAYSDLAGYIQLIVDSCSLQSIHKLLEWAANLQKEPESRNPKDRKQELCVYIFAVQVIYKIVSKHHELAEQWIPDWKKLVKVWKQYKSFEDSNDRNQAQKESRPADECILLAVQQLLWRNSSTENVVMAACILQAAIDYSPHNPYLKISAIFVFATLGAVSLSWNLFKGLYIKHIQHESCAFLIMPRLREGGFYQESLSVCQEILRLQIAALRDASEFTGRAMENGTYSKADEFLRFQRTRLNRSMTTLEAKGLILDFAPMFVQDEYTDTLGAVHGIVGGEEDLERAQKMIAEAHNPFAAFSLLHLRGSVEENLLRFSENRDLEVLSFDLLGVFGCEDQKQIISDCIRRCCHHNLLIRASICANATKGPKKGKLTKASPELERRCKSLSRVISFISSHHDLQPPGYQEFLLAMMEISRTIVILAIGFVSESDSEDTLATREAAAASVLDKAVGGIEKGRQLFTTDREKFIGRVSSLIPDCLIPLFALFQMCSSVLESYGWGRRKQNKLCGVAINRVAESITKVVNDLDVTIESSEGDFVVPHEVATLVDSSAATAAAIMEGREVTSNRIDSIISSIRAKLEVVQDKT